MGDERVFGWRILRVSDALEDVFRVEALPELSEGEEGLAFELRKAYVENGGERELTELLAGICLQAGVELDAEQEEYLKRFVLLDAEWGGPLGVLAEDERLEEIAVVGIGTRKPVFVYVKGEGWKQANCCFTELGALVNSINRLAKPLGRRITLRNPRINAVLKNGCRLHATIPPLSEGEVTIRRFRETPFSPSDLVANNTFSAQAMAFLGLAMQSDASILVAGNTGSGKTSTLNALFSFVPLSERVLAVEETPEIRVLHPNFCRLVAREEMSLGLGELSADSLRMRPDRVIVGEARDSKEAKALFDAMLGGQARGCYATIHARSGNEALARLSSLGIPERDLGALDLIVVQKRLARNSQGKSSEVRRCVEISEVSLAEGNARAKELFSFNPKRDSLEMNSVECGVAQKIADSFGEDEGWVEREVRRQACLF